MTMKMQRAWAHGLELKVFDSKKFFWFMLVVGTIFFVSGFLAFFYSDIPAEGARWLCLLGSIGLSAVMAVVVVELAVPQVEVHFFQALMAMPSSWALYKFWLFMVSVFFTFEALWEWSSMAVGEEETRGAAASFTSRIINVLALFTTVTMVLVILSKIMVSSLYSKKHSHKVLTALRQESILADLAECVAPIRLTSVTEPQRTPFDNPPPPSGTVSPHVASLSPIQLVKSSSKDLFGRVSAGDKQGAEAEQSSRAATMRSRPAPNGGAAGGVPLIPLGLPRVRPTGAGLGGNGSVGGGTMGHSAWPSGELSQRVSYRGDGGSVSSLHRAPSQPATGGSPAGTAATGAARAPPARGASGNGAGRPPPTPHPQARLGMQVGTPGRAEDRPRTPERAMLRGGSGEQHTVGSPPSGPSSLLQPPLQQLVSSGLRRSGEQPAAAGSSARSSSDQQPQYNGVGGQQGTQGSRPAGGGPMQHAMSGETPRDSLLGLPWPYVVDVHGREAPTPAGPQGPAHQAGQGQGTPSGAQAGSGGGSQGQGLVGAHITSRSETGVAGSSGGGAAGGGGSGMHGPGMLHGIPLNIHAGRASSLKPSQGHLFAHEDTPPITEEAGPAEVSMMTTHPSMKKLLPDTPLKDAGDTPKQQQGDGAETPRESDQRPSWLFRCWSGCMRWPATTWAWVSAAWVTVREDAAENAEKLRDLQTAVLLQDAGTVHIRRTLVQALYLVHKLSSKSMHKTDAHQAAAAALRAAHSNQAALAHWSAAAKAANKQIVRSAKSAPTISTEPQPRTPPTSKSADAAGNETGGQYQEPHPWTDNGFHDNPPTWLKLTSPRRLLDELLAIYGGLADGELSSMASTYAKMVFTSVSPVNPNFITRQDLINVNIHPEGVEMVWDLFDKDGDDEITLEEIRLTAVSFYQQRRNLAQTVHAMRNLTLSINITMTLLVNGVFLMVVYLALLNVTAIFGANKTSLDFFSAYILVISLMFGEVIRGVLNGAVLLLAQQPFDIGEEIIVEEAPSWRYMGIIQDFNLIYLRIKKSTDGELVTLPLSRVTTGKFTNLSRSDWKIEQNYYTVDFTAYQTAVLQRITDNALAHIKAHPTEYDTEYGFACYFHGMERPNKIIIRTFHRYRFNLASPHRRIAKAREGVVSAICKTFIEMNINFIELRMHLPYPPPQGSPGPGGHPSDMPGDHGGSHSSAFAQAAGQYPAPMPYQAPMQPYQPPFWASFLPGSGSGSGSAGPSPAPPIPFVVTPSSQYSPGTNFGPPWANLGPPSANLGPQGASLGPAGPNIGPWPGPQDWQAWQAYAASSAGQQAQLQAHPAGVASQQGQPANTIQPAQLAGTSQQPRPATATQQAPSQSQSLSPARPVNDVATTAFQPPAVTSPGDPMLPSPPTSPLAPASAGSFGTSPTAVSKTVNIVWSPTAATRTVAGSSADHPPSSPQVTPSGGE